MADWRQHLADREAQAEVHALRQYTDTGRPLGSSEFVARCPKFARVLCAPAWESLWVAQRF